MRIYRIYHVETRGRLRVGATLDARTDEEAAAAARTHLSPGDPAELWHGGRMVGRFTAAHEFLPGAG